MKKIFALVLALMLVLGMVNALADISITVTRDDTYADSNADYARKYTYVKVLDAKKGTDDAISYYLSSSDPWLAKLQAAPSGYFNITPNFDNSVYYVSAGTGFTNATANTVAEWLYSNIPTTVTETEIPVNADLDTWTVTGLTEGYYLVIAYEKASNATDFTRSAKLIAATTNISIAEKNDYPKIKKEQREFNAEQWIKDNLKVKIGDPIEYKVTVDVPANADMPIYVTDTMSVGLDYDASSMLIKVGDGAAAATNANVTEIAKQTGDTFTWKYSIAANDDTRGKTVVFTFVGKVNTSAIVDTGKQNEVELVYGNTDYKIPDHVDYEIYATGALKFDGGTATVGEDNVLVQKDTNVPIKTLDGAHFKLQVKVGSAAWADLAVKKVTDATNGDYYRPTVTGETGEDIITPSTGEIILRGLDNENQYRLVETKAPDGFNLMNPAETSALTLVKETKTGTPVEITDPYQMKIANNKGTELPHTGGIGTTLFYVGGGLLALIAVVLLVTKRRMNVNE